MFENLRKGVRADNVYIVYSAPDEFSGPKPPAPKNTQTSAKR